MEKTKENKYTVIKNSDLLDSLTETERHIFNLLVNKLSQGKTSRKYYVVNTDEPYAHKVLETILEGEECKSGDWKQKIINLLSSGLKSSPSKSENVLIKIPFNFTSFPLLGNIELEIEPVIGKILQDIQALELTEYSWNPNNLERFRDTYSFQDVYIGEIEIYERNNKMEL